MSPITTHVLNMASGKPAAGMSVKLEIQDSVNSWKLLAEGITNSDGRIMDLLDDQVQLDLGIYQITFATGDYFISQNLETFYPYASIVFEIKESQEHYHVHLLLCGYGYTKYLVS